MIAPDRPHHYTRNICEIFTLLQPRLGSFHCYGKHV